MTDATEKYWVVEFKAFAFDSKEQAADFADRLLDLFMDMPGAEGIGSSTRIVEEEE